MEEGQGPTEPKESTEGTGIIGGDLGNNTEEEIQHNVNLLKAASHEKLELQLNTVDKVQHTPKKRVRKIKRSVPQ